MSMEMEEFNRKSLLTHLARGDFYRAEQKIEDNISQININLNHLERYCGKVLSKKDKKEFILKGNKILEETGGMFEETLLLIKDFQSHKFTNRKDRIRYLTVLEGFEKRTIKAKHKFEEISEKLNTQNRNAIEIERHSMMSRKGSTINNAKTTANEAQLFRNRLDEQLVGYEYKEDLDDTLIEERGRQIQLIVKIMGDVQKLSTDCLGTLVHSKEYVDSIADNLVSTKHRTEDALMEIKKADEINKNRHSSESFFSLNKIIIFLLIFVAILLLASLSK